MILGSFNWGKSTKGKKSRGSAGPSRIRLFSSLSNSKEIGRRQCPHSVRMLQDKGASLSRPCTKGVAMASIAQAALIRSPVLNEILWGVSSTVTGYAQATHP